jgi:hypothetical protein
MVFVVCRYFFTSNVLAIFLRTAKSLPAKSAAGVPSHLSASLFGILLWCTEDWFLFLHTSIDPQFTFIVQSTDPQISELTSQSNKHDSQEDCSSGSWRSAVADRDGDAQ